MMSIIVQAILKHSLLLLSSPGSKSVSTKTYVVIWFGLTITVTF